MTSKVTQDHRDCRNILLLNLARRNRLHSLTHRSAWNTHIFRYVLFLHNRVDRRKNTANVQRWSWRWRMQSVFLHPVSHQQFRHVRTHCLIVVGICLCMHVCGVRHIIAYISKMGTVTNGFDARLANRPFLVFDFLALWRSTPSARVPESRN